jgi:NADH-quinone oxidoreductase subunit L
MTHAFFKALLFLSAGSVMHALAGELNMQKMGGLKKYLPTTFLCFLAGTLAISGIPLFSGFFSKDEILWKAFSSPHGHILLWVVGVVTAGLTAFYMFRLFFMTFMGKSRMDAKIEAHVHESPKPMTIPLMVLAVLSVIGGYVGIPHVLGGSNRIEGFLSSVFAHGESAAHEAAHHSASTEYLLMAISIVVVLIAILVAYRFYVRDLRIPKRLAEKYRSVYQVLLNKYYVDELYAKVIVNPLLNLALLLWKRFDVLVIDGAANGIASLVKGAGSVIRRTQTGYLRNYALSLILGAALILVYYIFR